MDIRRVWKALLFVGVPVFAVGCGGDPLDPNVTGTVNAEIHDTPSGSAAFTGTAAGNFFVSIRSTDGTWVDLGSPNGITVNLQSSSGTTVHGASSVPVGSYDRVRVTLSGVTFSIDAGGTVSGNVLGADASAVAAGSTPLELELSVTTFDVSEAGATVGISFDLNVENWIDQQSLDDGVIQDGRIQGQLTVAVTRG